MFPFVEKGWTFRRTWLRPLKANGVYHVILWLVSPDGARWNVWRHKGIQGLHFPYGSFEKRALPACGNAEVTGFASQGPGAAICYECEHSTRAMLNTEVWLRAKAEETLKAMAVEADRRGDTLGAWSIRQMSTANRRDMLRGAKEIIRRAPNAGTKPFDLNVIRRIGTTTIAQLVEEISD
jgi:hypothetical protein